MSELERRTIDVFPTRRLRVGIVCGNEILRYGLKAALDRLPTVTEVCEISPRSAALNSRLFYSLDVIVVSYTEWATAQQIIPLARAADARVLAFVDDATVKDPEKLVLLRPDGFILQRQLTARALEDALLRVSRSEAVVPSEVFSEVFESAARAMKSGYVRFVELTPRERETLELLADGLSNKDIARKLSISVYGVKRLVGNILLKLNCLNRTQAVVLAMRHGLVTDRR